MLVDCGDFGSSKAEPQRLKVDYLIKGMGLLHYDAINLGEKDLQYGIEYLTEKQKAYHLPFISANVYRAGTEELFAKPYVIVKKHGVKVGIFGVTTNSRIVRVLVPASTGFEIRDPIEAAKRAVAELKKKCDVVVALSHLGAQGSKKLAIEVPGIDVIISGHGRNILRRPVHIGDAVIMQAGAQGKYLGQIDFAAGSGGLKLVKGDVVALSSRIQDDKREAKLVAEFDRVAAEKFPASNNKH
ncbi:MAG: hypothetical protein D6743_13085 [Calditrichaeota bacterium]|nr:MAG: hypothetical protein D6743_13085 [Calditrichota bacterium]